MNIILFCVYFLEDGSDRSPTKRSGRLLKGLTKMVSLPGVLREVKARDQNAQISGYLNSHTSKSKRWKKRWYIVYNLVLYEFERHEVRISIESIFNYSWST